MNVNSLSSKSFFAAKEDITSIYQKKENNPLNKVVKSINNRMENEAAILEISNQSIQKLMVRNLYKIEEFKGRISENLKVIKEKYDILFEADSKLKNISDLVEKYKKLMSDEGLETNDSHAAIEDMQTRDNSKISEEFLEESKTIIEKIKEFGAKAETDKAKELFLESVQGISDMLKTTEAFKTESALPETSETKVQELQAISVHKVEDLGIKILMNFNEIKYTQIPPLKSNDSLDDISDSVKEFMGNLCNEIVKVPSKSVTEKEIFEAKSMQVLNDNNKSDELLESGKTITESINDLADMIADIEQMKAEREGTEYDVSGSIAESFKHFSLSDISKSRDILNKAKNLVQKEIQEIYKEIAKIMEKIEKILDSEKKEILSKKENVSDQISFIDNVINNL